MTRLPRGPVPLHHQVYLDLDAKLGATWGEGDRLPPERELARHYGCSLVTVRRALDELARERRIERQPGRGTFVSPPPIERDLAALTSFTEEMRARGLDPHTRLLRSGPGRADEPVSRALAIEPGAPTVLLERLRLAGGRPLLLEQVHLSATLVPDLMRADLERESLYDLLSRKGVRPVRAREIIEPVLLSAREAELLEHDPARPALTIELVAFTRTGTPVEYCRSLVPGDRARYYVEAEVPRRDVFPDDRQQFKSGLSLTVDRSSPPKEKLR
jgi:GntR family transcriptional regulator